MTRSLLVRTFVLLAPALTTTPGTTVAGFGNVAVNGTSAVRTVTVSSHPVMSSHAGSVKK